MVLILADDLGWSDLGCYGADYHQTPHLDGLARGGLRFTQAYAASVCSPTRAALLTGRHYARLHITTYREAAATPPRDRPLLPQVAASDLPHSERTLAEALKPAGYLTALVGKWHLGDAAHFPETQGFDWNIGGNHWGAPFSYFFPYRGLNRSTGEFRYVPRLEGGKEGEYLTDRLTDEALRVIDAAGDRPFFLYLAHYAVHTPIQARPERVEHDAARLRPGLRHRNPVYAAMVQSLDQSVGRVLEKLRERGIADRTAAIFTSDNGGYTNVYNNQVITDNFPLRSGKGSLYEGGVRVPLIIQWPGLTPAGATCDEPVACHDLFPTVLDALGLAHNATDAPELDGVSLRPLLQDPAARLGRDALYFHFPHYYYNTHPVSAIRAGRWKLLEYLEDKKRELYDLAADPGESRDLAAVEPGLTADLAGRLARWRERVGVQMPVPNPPKARENRASR